MTIIGLTDCSLSNDAFNNTFTMRCSEDFIDELANTHQIVEHFPKEHRLRPDGSFAEKFGFLRYRIVIAEGVYLDIDPNGNDYLEDILKEGVRRTKSLKKASKQNE